MSSPIAVSSLKKFFDAFSVDSEEAEPQTVAKLKEYGLITEDKKYNTQNSILMEDIQNKTPDAKVMLVGGKLQAIARTKDASLAPEPKEESRVGMRVDVARSSDIILSSKEDITKAIDQQSYTMDMEKLKATLEKFVRTIRLEDETYKQGDLPIFHFGDRLADVPMLIAAGTKILDAIAFASMREDAANNGLFVEKEVKEGITEREIVMNTKKGKRALQAGIVLVFVQGSLPGNKAHEDRKVPNFIIDKLYEGENISMDEIAKDLSAVSTVKFPARVLLQMNLDLLPLPVASRCKLNVAGNRGIRYAVYAASFDKREELAISDDTPVSAMYQKMEENKKIKLARELRETLASLDGCYKNQLVMHPLSESKPSTKNFTLKLTCAIIFSLSKSGRKAMAEKIISDKNEAFKRDIHFFGTGDAEKRDWPILKNIDADFSGLSVEGLKNIYKIHA
nr:TPA_asm: coat protein [Adonis ophiovirus]